MPRKMKSPKGRMAKRAARKSSYPTKPRSRITRIFQNAFHWSSLIVVVCGIMKTVWNESLLAICIGIVICVGLIYIFFASRQK